MLTNEKAHYTNMLQKEEDHVQVSRPITIDRTMIRTRIFQRAQEYVVIPERRL